MTRRELIRNRGLLGLLARDVVSAAGSQMTMLSLPWFVLTTTGSASRIARPRVYASGHESDTR